MNKQEKLAADLTASTYDAVADPARLEQFFAAWDLYMDLRADFEKAGDNVELFDPAVQAHFQRGIELFDLIGRKTKRFDPQSYVDGLPGPALILDDKGNIVAKKPSTPLSDKPWRTLLDVPIDEEARGRIRQWAMGNLQPRSPFVFVPCFWDDLDTKTCLLAMEIEAEAQESNSAGKRYYLISSVDLAMDKNVTDAFATAYELSDAEAEIAMLLSQGLAPERIAKKRSVSINTIRSQLRAVLGKTNAWGIQDLVRICCNFSAHFHQLEFPRTSEPYKGSDLRDDTITLRDGRTLSYHEMGDPEGEPVLMFHSVMSAPFLTSFAMQACRRRNIRIIAPSAPGYGKSSPVPGLLDSEFVATVVGDAGALLDHLEIQKVKVIGNVLGAVFAQRFARDHPERTQALIMIGYATHFDPNFLDDMHALHRTIGKTLLKSRKALPFMVRGYLGLLDTGDTAKLIKATHAPSELDWKDLRHPDILEVVLDGIRHCLEQGHEPACQFVLINVTDWMHEGADVQCPVTIIKGEHDTTLSDRFYAPYVQKYENATVVTIKGAGKFMTYTQWEEILDVLQQSD